MCRRFGSFSLPNMPQAKLATSAGGDREILPTLTLYQSVLFPGMRCRVELATVRAYGAVVEATRSLGEKAVAVFAARGALPRDPGLDQLFEVGSVARVLSLQRLPCCHRFIAELEAVARIRSDAHLREQPFRLASVRRLPEPEQDRVLVESLTRAVQDGARRIASRSPHCYERAPGAVAAATDRRPDQDSRCRDGPVSRPFAAGTAARPGTELAGRAPGLRAHADGVAGQRLELTSAAAPAPPIRRAALPPRAGNPAPGQAAHLPEARAWRR